MNYIQNSTKINQLMKKWPKGTIKTVTELRELGYSPQLLKTYSNSGWIELYTRGMYKLSDDEVGWQGVLYGLQKKNNTTIHAGARTALELKGFGHFARIADAYLFSDTKEEFPLIFNKVPDVVKRRTDVFPFNDKSIYSNYDAGGFEIRISSPELAVMEMIYLIPSKQTFNEALLIMENLTGLRPKKVQQLLEQCTSSKVKRVFMWMAEKCDHTWVNDLILSKIDFGKGKRSIVKNGKLDKKYLITVPRENAE